MTDSNKKGVSIWWFAFGYFAAYVPYTFMTKTLTKGFIVQPPISSFEILPVSVGASVISMIIFISAMRWWQFAAHSDIKLGSKTISVPHPTKWTLLSGICTGFVVVTTTLAYTIDGVSIVFAMLLMRGGMLVMSPFVDLISGRHVRWFSWCALGMSIASLVVAFALEPTHGGSRFGFNTLLLIDVAVYLTAYFVRLRFMTKLAKSDDPAVTKKYFVEEQMVGTPFILATLFILSLFADPSKDPTNLYNSLHAGFTTFFTGHSPSIILVGIAIGVCSQFTGVFGGLILLDKSENAFAVPVNRCSSILAGVVSTLALAVVFPQATLPGMHQFVGAAFIIGAILFLTIPPMREKKRKKQLELAQK